MCLGMVVEGAILHHTTILVSTDKARAFALVRTSRSSLSCFLNRVVSRTVPNCSACLPNRTTIRFSSAMSFATCWIAAAFLSIGRFREPAEAPAGGNSAPHSAMDDRAPGRLWVNDLLANLGTECRSFQFKFCETESEKRNKRESRLAGSRPSIPPAHLWCRRIRRS